MYKLPITLAVWSIATGPANATGVNALPQTLPTYQQDFSIYQDRFFPNRQWGLMNPTVPSAYGQRLSKDQKEAYSDGSTLEFEARWARRAIKAMLKENFKPLMKEYGIHQLRAAIDRSGCRAQMEVGLSTIYNGQLVHDTDSSQNIVVTELDSGTNRCDNRFTIDGQSYPLYKEGNPSSVRLRTFVPTVPGSEYAIDLTYATRTSGGMRDFSQSSVIVRIGSQSIQSAEIRGIGELGYAIDGRRIDLPLEFDTTVSESDLEHGFFKATIRFVAHQYYTPIVVRANDKADSYGPVINQVHSRTISTAPHFGLCSALYPPHSNALRKCLNAEDPAQTLLTCDLPVALSQQLAKGDSAKGLSSFVRVNKEGLRNGNANRYDPASMVRDDWYYSLGKAGKTTVRLNCPIEGKTLSFSEFTGGNQNYQQYAEKGIVKIKTVCLDSTKPQDGWQVLSSNGDNVLTTNEAVSKTFGSDYQGCRLTHIRFIDKTHKIPSTQQGYIANSDGMEINQLKIED